MHLKQLFEQPNLRFPSLRIGHLVYPVELVPVRHGDWKTLARLTVADDGDPGGGEVPVAPLGRLDDVGPARHRESAGHGVRTGLETESENFEQQLFGTVQAWKSRCEG